MNTIQTAPLLTGEFHKNRNAFVVQGEPLIFHCHHYNTFLQLSIEETKHYLDVYPILQDTAQEVAYAQFNKFFKSNSELSVIERKEVVSKAFSEFGFGAMGLDYLSAQGGTVVLPTEHYSATWMLKYGPRTGYDCGAALFATGFVAGATEAIFDLPLGSLETRQIECPTKGHSQCTIVASPSIKPRTLEASPAEGMYQTFDALPQPQDTGIRYEAIQEALTEMPIVGGKDGLIQAFGVTLTRHYANYYTQISYRLLKAMQAKFGADGVHIVKDLLVEAGHVCAFNTFGGIMESAEWNALIQPMIDSREDWVHGIVACVNALGWGQWEVKELVPYQKLVVEVKSGYEANSYQQSFGQSDYPVSYLVTGGVAGIMNLIYNGDITETPELNEAYYDQIFKSPNKFSAKQTKCRAMGDSVDRFEATKQ
ncbi:MAG: hypothetical protein WA958_06120 [Tunicatimonas sp.]